jgi:hypothetical protein
MARPVVSLEAVLLAVAFAVAHTQSPLFYSNQNQYLLHGAALAHHGSLASDWLATTTDPTPLFSALAGAAFALHPFALQVAHFVLLMAYFLAARRLARAVPGVPDARAARLAFAALFTAAHAGIVRYASVQLAGVDFPWYLQAGVAAQYLLGPGVQPSAFGVLLLAACAALAHGRARTACALAALTCWFHATYLLPSALVVVGAMYALARESKWRGAFQCGALALVLVVPPVAYSLWHFSPFAPDSAEAQRVLALVRIPHHCVVARWFDGVAAVQLAWVALGLLLLRGTALGRALCVAALGGTLLTLAVAGREADVPGFALAFPWRVSVLLVPVATTVVCAKLLTLKPPGARGAALAGAALGALVTGGALVTALGLGYGTVKEEESLYAWAREHAGPNDVFLIPTAFPKVSSGRGAVSNTFAPPPRANPETNQIPVDLQRFRLAGGARLYVDFKSVPYAAGEVLEWQRRMRFAVDANGGAWSVEALKREGITHVVAPASKLPPLPGATEAYRDAAYVVLRLP